MSNINTKDIKDFCSEEREGIILKQKIKIQALEKENAELVTKIKAANSVYDVNHKLMSDIVELEKEIAELRDEVSFQNDLIIKYENQCSFENPCEPFKSLETKTKLLVEKLEKAKKVLLSVKADYRSLFMEDSSTAQEIRQILKELEA